MSFSNFQRIKASRKSFECGWCQTECCIGQPRVSFFGMWEGEIQNWSMHPECYDAFQREDDGDGSIHDEKHNRGMTCGEMMDAKALSPSHKESCAMIKLDRVTITGADDSVEPEALIPLTKKYPWVEWGILFSGSRQGGPRYPSDAWIGKLAVLCHSLPNLSAHLCGQWVRDLVLEGEATWWAKYDPLPSIFNRIQLNFHGQFHKACTRFTSKLKGFDHDFILQHDGVNDETIIKLGDALRVFPLFDRSGGAGVLPASWPKPIWKYQGYAGGLGPENIKTEIEKIAQVAGDNRIWIDMETRVRSDDDRQFDLGKVEACLKAAEPFVSSK